jgi:glycosyltransferase involved in cell wall biosynthesis
VESSEEPVEPKAPRVLLVIPCYDEAQTIRQVLDEVASLPTRYDTVVIDDGSRDGTYEAARELSPCIRLPFNLGIGGAVQTGLRYAYRHGYDLCAQVDGDGQHAPAELADLMAAYEERKANVTIGSRYISNGGFRSTWLRRVGGTLIGYALRIFCGKRLTDPTSGMRLLDRTAIKLFATTYPLDFPEPISNAMALLEGLSVEEVSVKMRARDHGRSSITGLQTINYMLRVLGFIVLLRLGKGLGRRAAHD